MPSSSHSASRNSPGDSRGLRISAISAFFGARASSERMVVVLPVPTSPVSWMKPPASFDGWIDGARKCSGGGLPQLLWRKIIDIDELHHPAVIVGEQLRFRLG